MPRHSLPRRAPILTLAAFLVAVGFGITFPLISLRLEATGVSGIWLGLNAAMPALGWIVGASLLPFLQITLGVAFKRLLQLFLIVGVAALFALRYAEGYEAMTALRFGFGGAIGIVFRCIEFWINDASQNDDRGKNIGIYNILFMIALIIGSSVQPVLGTVGWAAFGTPLVLMGAGLLLIQFWTGTSTPLVQAAIPPRALGTVLSAPIALLAVIAYGIFESVPTTLMPVYAVRNEIDTATAAHTLTAAALGNLIFQYPIAALSDRVGRRGPLLLCASIVACTSALIPATLDDKRLLLLTIAVWGGAAGVTYSLALAEIGDRFQGAQLVVANAAFGVVYAIGSIVGPVLNGLAIDRLNSHGLMAWLAVVFAILVVALGLTGNRSARGVP